MSNYYFGIRPRHLAVASVFLLACLRAPAANNWTNTVSALWRSPTNWSLATAPTSASNVDPTQITNAVTKSVTIDSATAAANLSLRGLTISAPAGSTNALSLLNVPLGTPLTTSKAFLVGNRGALRITNSAVNATSDFDIVNGSLILDSGSLACALNCDLQSGSMTVNSGTLTATAGTTGIRMGRFNGAIANFTINGGTVSTLRVTLGSVTGTQNSLALAGGNLICNDSLSLAQIPGTTGNATMTAGNLVVTNGTTKIADRATASFTQSGGNTAFADLSIGDLGLGTFNLNAGQLTVSPRTTNDLCIVGNLENGVLNQSGGVAVIRSELHVADFGGVFGDVNVSGGQFYATNDLVAIGREGIGQMTISNALVVLTNTSVGRHAGSSGVVTLQANANLFFIADLSIGRLPGASGQIFVNGGLLSITNDDLWVGRGGSGEMTIAGGVVRAKTLHVGNSDDGINAPIGTLTLTGGTTLISSNLVVGTSGLATGQATMSGGELIITNSSATARLEVGQGGFTLDGGNLSADRILVTTNTGQFTFNSGTIRARSLTVANGSPLVIGDGVNAATLELQGGVYTFANGLVISPNATVTGCGSLIGAITNNGTLATNCGPDLAITSVTKSGNAAMISFTTIASSNHILEYKTNLSAPTWSAILPGVVGNGSVMSKADDTATNAARFYRIKLQ